MNSFHFPSVFISFLKFLADTAESYFISFFFSPPCFQNRLFFTWRSLNSHLGHCPEFIFLFAIPLKKKNTICSALIIISLRICYSFIVRKFNTVLLPCKPDSLDCLVFPNLKVFYSLKFHF